MIKTAVITGASSGIGKALARLLIESDWKVHGLCSGLRAHDLDTQVHWTAADFTDPTAVARATEAVSAEVGNAGLDLLVHCAGVFPVNLSPEAIASLWQIHVATPYALTEKLGPLLKRGSKVIFVGSVSGLRAQPGHELYGASKAAEHFLVRSLAFTYSTAGIQVLGLAPGLVDTPMSEVAVADTAGLRQLEQTLPTGRIARAKDIATLILEISRLNSPWLTGQVLDATGGALLGFGGAIRDEGGNLRAGFKGN